MIIRPCVMIPPICHHQFSTCAIFIPLSLWLRKQNLKQCSITISLMLGAISSLFQLTNIFKLMKPQLQSLPEELTRLIVEFRMTLKVASIRKPLFFFQHKAEIARIDTILVRMIFRTCSLASYT